MTKNQLGPHVAALVALMREGKRRTKPLAALREILARRRLPPDVRALLEAWSEHRQTFISVGEYTIEDDHIADRVPDERDRDRDDVLCVGRSIGGDVWVVAQDGSSSAVTRLIHDEGFCDGPGFKDLEAMLKAMVKDEHDDGEETDLDDALAPRKAPTAGDLAIVAIARAPAARKASAATRKQVKGADEVVGRYGVIMGDDRRLTIVDDQAGRAIAVNPKIVVNHYCQSADGSRVLAPTSEGLWEIDAASGKATRLIAKTPLVSACYVGERVACTLLEEPFKLQLYTRSPRGALEADGAPVACKRLQTLGLAADGRLVALFSDTPDQRCHLLGVQGSELRPLATVRGLYTIWDTDGRVFLKDWKGRASEVKNLDRALASAFAGRKVALSKVL